MTVRNWIGLSMITGLGPAGVWAALSRFGTPEAALAAPAEQWRHIPGIRQRVTEQLNADQSLDRADREIKKLAALGGIVITWESESYPSLLRETACPPPVLYVRGQLEVLNCPAVAVIGSRAASSYGRRAARAISRQIAGQGLSVVSGLAEGIDAAAHEGCLDAGGNTIGVLGCGLDVVYPRINGPLYRRIADAGLLVSEYPLGTRPEPFRFPARNRVIAGMSLGVAVVEASRRSGTLITVQHALDEGREVFAVPGQIDSAKSAGSHWLIQQGATLVVSGDDILAAFGHPVRPSSPDTGVEVAGGEDPQVEAVFGMIDAYPVARDELVRHAGLGTARLSEILLLLELEGRVEVLPGDRLRKIG